MRVMIYLCQPILRSQLKCCSRNNPTNKFIEGTQSVFKPPYLYLAHALASLALPSPYSKRIRVARSRTHTTH